MKPDDEDNHSQNLAIYTQKTLQEDSRNLAIYTQKILKEATCNYLQLLQAEAMKAAQFKAEIAKSADEQFKFIGSTISATWLDNPPELCTLSNQHNSNHYQITYNQQQYNHYYGHKLPRENKDKGGNNPTPQPKAPSIKSKSLNNHLRVIAALCRLVERYETMSQPKPGQFKNRKIVLSTGKISMEALRELLQEIDPETPRRAEQVMKKAEAFLEEADDIISQALKEK